MIMVFILIGISIVNVIGDNINGATFCIASACLILLLEADRNRQEG